MLPSCTLDTLMEREDRAVTNVPFRPAHQTAPLEKAASNTRQQIADALHSGHRLTVRLKSQTA